MRKNLSHPTVVHLIGVPAAFEGVRFFPLWSPNERPTEASLSMSVITLATTLNSWVMFMHYPFITY